MPNRKLVIIVSIIIVLIVGVIYFVARKGVDLAPGALEKQDQLLDEAKKTDSDLDGLSNADEAKLGTDANSVDTDKDGLLDRDEINKFKTDPLKVDTDGDGKKDGYEVRRAMDPLKKN